MTRFKDLATQLLDGAIRDINHGNDAIRLLDAALASPPPAPATARPQYQYVHDGQTCRLYRYPASTPLPTHVTDDPARYKVSKLPGQTPDPPQPPQPTVRVVGSESDARGQGIYNIANRAKQSGYWGMTDTDLRRRSSESVQERLPCLGGEPQDLEVTLIPLPGLTPRELRAVEAAVIRGHRSSYLATCNIHIPQGDIASDGSPK